jgi:hypothetical protein
MSALPALANLVPLRQAGALGPSSSRPGAPPSFFADAHAIRAANGLVRAAGKKEMDDRAKKLMTLKAQLEEEKHEYDKLKLNLEQGEMDAEDAGDIDAIQQEHSKLRSEAESYRKQVEHQRKDVAIAAEKISTLEQRFLEVRERRIEAVRKCHKAKGGVEEVEAEVRVLQKQLTQRGYQKKELQAERFSLQEKLGKETKDIVMSDHVTSTADAQKTRSSGFKESKKRRPRCPEETQNRTFQFIPWWFRSCRRGDAAISSPADQDSLGQTSQKTSRSRKIAQGHN